MCSCLLYPLKHTVGYRIYRALARAKDGCGSTSMSQTQDEQQTNLYSHEDFPESMTTTEEIQLSSRDVNHNVTKQSVSTEMESTVTVVTEYTDVLDNNKVNRQGHHHSKPVPSTSSETDNVRFPPTDRQLGRSHGKRPINLLNSMNYTARTFTETNSVGEDIDVDDEDSSGITDSEFDWSEDDLDSSSVTSSDSNPGDLD